MREVEEIGDEFEGPEVVAWYASLYLHSEFHSLNIILLYRAVHSLIIDTIFLAPPIFYSPLIRSLVPKLLALF